MAAAQEKPAIAGGKPAKTKPFAKLPRYGDEELAELKEAIAQGTLFYAGGKKVKALEKEFAAKHGVSDEEALKKGMEVKSIEFVKQGGEIYSKQ